MRKHKSDLHSHHEMMFKRDSRMCNYESLINIRNWEVLKLYIVKFTDDDEVGDYISSHIIQYLEMPTYNRPTPFKKPTK